MKKLYFPFLMIVLCLTLTCSENSAGPDWNALIASESIGVAGGTIASENFIVRVPSGTLDSTVTISLYKTVVASPFDADAVTEKLYIEGLPGDFGAPVDFYLKTDSTVGDSSWVALGEYCYFPEGDSTGYNYSIIRAADSSGYLHCRIPADGDAMPVSKRNADDPDFANPVYVLFGLKDLWQYTSTEHFIICHLAEYAGVLEPLETALETNYGMLQLMNIDVSKFARKIGVCLHNIGKIHTVPSISYRGEDVYADIFAGFIGPDGLDSQEFLDAVGGAVFQCIPNLYLDAEKSRRYSWVRTALKYWRENGIEGSTIDCGPYYDANQFAPLYGIQPNLYNTEKEKAAFGAGMVPLIKYLTRHETVAIFKDIFGDMSYYNYHFFEAIDSNITNPVFSWWVEFIKEHLSGEYCPIDAEKIINEKSGTFNIASEDDTTGTFSIKYSDLQSRLFYIGLNYDGFNDADMLKLTLTGDESLESEETWAVLFKYKNNTLTFLSSGYNIVYVPLLKSMYDNGEDIVAVVINSHYNRTYFYPDLLDIDLKVDYIPTTEANFNFVKVSFSVKPEYEDYDGVTYWGASNYSRDWSFNGSNIGGVFTGTPDPSWHGEDATGTITINFSPTTFDITSLSAELNEYSTGNSYEMSLEAANIPHTASLSWEECKVSGTATCSHITSMGWFWVWDLQAYKWTTLKSYTCEDENHYIKVEFWDTQ